MRRFVAVPTAILTVVFLVAGCTSSDDTADEPTTATPATTVAPVETATTTAPAATVAAPETAATAEAVADEPTSKVLFVGNSLSYNNGGVEQHVELLAASADPPLVIQTEAIFRSNARLASNWEYVSQRGSIEPGAYDMVVLQSTLAGTTDVATFHDAVRSFAEHIREAGAEPVLFMAWPITRYGVDPISVEEIAEAHQDIAAELDVRVAPVGLAWQRAMEERPEIDLYSTDENHPSLPGTYLAAVVIFGTLYGEDFTDLDYLCQDCVTGLHPDGLTEDEAIFLQRIARETLQEYHQVIDGSS